MAQRKTTTISVTPTQKREIQKLVASGKYRSSDAVIQRSLRALKYHDQVLVETVEQLRAKIEEGMDDVRAGRVFNGEEVFREIRARSRSARRKIA